MKISYDPSATRGEQYSVTTDDGRSIDRTSQAIVLGLLRAAGATVRESQQRIAAAQLEANDRP